MEWLYLGHVTSAFVQIVLTELSQRSLFQEPWVLLAWCRPVILWPSKTARAASGSVTAAYQERWEHPGSFPQPEIIWFKYRCRRPSEIWPSNRTMQFSCEPKKLAVVTWLKYLQLLLQWRTAYVSPPIPNHCLLAPFSWISVLLQFLCLKNTFSEKILHWDFIHSKLLTFSC